MLIIFGARYLIFVSFAIAIIYFVLQPRARQKSIAILSIVSGISVFVLSKIAGALYSDPRPFIAGHFTPLVPGALDNGFPSDHTLIATTIAAIIFCYNKTLGTILLAVAILIGTSRVLGGVHHVVDIIGAIVIASATVAAIYLLLGRKPFAPS